MIPYVSPKFAEEAFNCPHCNAFANQTFQVFYGRATPHEYWYSICIHCRDIAIWNNTEMIYPLTSTAPLPNSDMPDDIKNDYKEARDIVNRSPRSACVLLRLCIEKICDEQKAKGRDLNEKIGDLVKRGLDESIQKALDAVRVIGGQAVHPLQMDLKDDIPTASSLFDLVNLISDWAHTRKKKIDAVYAKLPDSKKDAIDKRDGNTE